MPADLTRATSTLSPLQRACAGSIGCLAASPDGGRLYAATEEGCVLGWDTRKLNSTLCVVRAGRALSGGGGGAIVALSHHPSLPGVLCAQLSGGCCITLDAATAAVMAVRPPPAIEADGGGDLLAGGAIRGRMWNMRTGSDPTSHARIPKMTLLETNSSNYC